MEVEAGFSPVLITVPEDMVQFLSIGAQTQKLPTQDVLTYLFTQGFMGLELDEEMGEELFLEVGNEHHTFKLPSNLLENNFRVTSQIQNNMPTVGVYPPAYIEMLIANHKLPEIENAAIRRHTTLEGIIIESMHVGLFICNVLSATISQTSESVRLVVFKDGKLKVHTVQP